MSSGEDHRTPLLLDAPLLDYEPGIRPPKRQAEQKPSTLLTVCPYILGNEFCERLAYYG